MKTADRRTSAWREADPDNKDEDAAFWRAPSTIVVHDFETNTVNTGLLDKDGNEIHRQVMRPIGFIRFEG